MLALTLYHESDLFAQYNSLRTNILAYELHFV